MEQHVEVITPYSLLILYFFSPATLDFKHFTTVHLRAIIVHFRTPVDSIMQKYNR
jgi:hypothetical protein